MLGFSLIAMLLLFGALGCNRTRVTASDLTGTWVIRDASRQRLPAELRKASAKIVLEANRTFVASDVPGLFYVNPGRARLDTGSGVWKLVSREGRQQVQLDFHAIAERKEGAIPFGTQVYISGGSSAVILFYYVGDREEERRIELKRKNPSRAGDLGPLKTGTALGPPGVSVPGPHRHSATGWE